MVRHIGLTVLVAACGGGKGGGVDGAGGIVLIGECDPPGAATMITTTPISLFDQSCLTQDVNQVVQSDADWDAVFAGCGEPVPPNLDLTTQRAMIVSARCFTTDLRFAVETSNEVIVGVLRQLPGGACGGNILVVPLPRSMTSVRTAMCQESCPSCPPVP